MSSKARRALEERVQRAILQQAFLRWESAALIALTLLLTFFGPRLVTFIPNWAWFLGGLLGEAGLVWSSLSDPEFGRTVVTDLLQHEFQPQRLQNKALQRQVEKALDYRSRIATSVRTQSDGMMKQNLAETAGQIDEWLENIYNLARRLDRHQQEKQTLQQDQANARRRLAELEQELAGEQDPALKKQIEVTMASLQRQVETIESLDTTMERAELQLEHTLSALGTIYSQTMLVDAKDIDRSRAQRLQQDIAGEVTDLSDILAAMDEVYQQSS